MGIFDIFKKKEEQLEPSSPAVEKLAQAKEKYDKGEYQEALGILSWAFQVDVNYKPLYQLSSDTLGKMGAPDEQALFDNAISDFTDQEVFTAIASNFSKSGMYRVAMPFFEKAHSLAPTDLDIAHDLAIVYARHFMIAKAVETLAKFGIPGEFWALFFLAKCQLLNGNPSATERHIKQLDDILENVGDMDVSAPRSKVTELKEMLARYGTITNPGTNIRDWHYIQYGSAIIHLFETEDDYVAGGRWVALWGGNETITTTLVNLKLLLAALDLDIQLVQALSDRNAEIVGRAAAIVLNVPFAIYDGSIGNGTTLLVAADAHQFSEYDEMNVVKPNQILFALNQDWLNPSYVAPEIIGFMSQYYYYPWAGGGLRVDPETQQMVTSEEDTRTAEEIAIDIVNTQPDEDIVAGKVEYYANKKEYLKGIGKYSGALRYNFMIESPVPGAAFT